MEMLDLSRLNVLSPYSFWYIGKNTYSFLVKRGGKSVTSFRSSIFLVLQSLPLDSVSKESHDVASCCGGRCIRRPSTTFIFP